MGCLVKLDVKGGVDSSRKLWPYLLNEVDAVGLLNQEIVIALPAKDPSVVYVNSRSTWEDSEAKRHRMEGEVGRFLGHWVKMDPRA